MKTLSIAAVQSNSINGDIERNVNTHLRFLLVADRHEANWSGRTIPLE